MPKKRAKLPSSNQLKTKKPPVAGGLFKFCLGFTGQSPFYSVPLGFGGKSSGFGSTSPPVDEAGSSAVSSAAQPVMNRALAAITATAMAWVRYFLSISFYSFDRLCFAKVPPRHAAAVGASSPSPLRLATHFYPPDTKMWPQKTSRTGGQLRHPRLSRSFAIPEIQLLLLALRRHRDGDFLGHQRRVVRDVRVIREHQLQRVFARRQIQRHLRLATAEML